MKISEFAAINKVTAKMLRHYDEIGLLKPTSIDVNTGYRSYEESQSLFLSWILILKNLDFSLDQIKIILGTQMSSENFINELLQKRIEISLNMNNQIQKKMQLDRLIKILEREGFSMNKNINLMDFDKENVNELKKNMPNMEQFLENMESIINKCGKEEEISILRFDISHFKQVNDELGYEIGDMVILVCYNIIQESIRKLEDKAAIGRLGGDEFCVIMATNYETTEEVCKGIVETLKNYDFLKFGCNKKINCYIGVIITKVKPLIQMRSTLDDTIEVLNEARKGGPGSISIKTEG